MDLASFQSSVENNEFPNHLSKPLQALWLDKQGEWEQAHDLIQYDEAGAGAWVHAYLHRKEGDNGNANYWYRRANKKMPKESLKTEWEQIVETLLST